MKDNRRMRNQDLYGWGAMVMLILLLIGPAILNAEVIGDGVDLHGTIWFYGWIYDCINSLKNPSFTDQFYYPYGKDIFAHTGNNFVDAVLFYPFRLCLDYPYNYLIFIAFILILNCFSLNKLLRNFIGSSTVIWSATLFMLSSPFVLFELIAGRPTQACLFATPMAMLQLIEILNGDFRIRRAIYLGFWVALQGYIYWFYGYFLVGVLSMLYLSHRQIHGVNRWRIIMSMSLSILVCLICVGPMVWGMLGRLEHELVPGMSNFPVEFGSLPNLQNNVQTTLHGILQLEGDTQPVFTVLPWGFGLLLTVFHPKTRWNWGLALCFTLIASVGPVLELGEHSILNYPYLWAYHYLPFYGRLWFPYRWVSMSTIIIVVGTAIVVEHWANKHVIRIHPVSIVVPFLLAAPQLASHKMLPLESVSLNTPSIYMEMAKHGGALIELPIGISKPSLAYQADHHMPTFGGMGENARIFSPPGHLKRLQNGFIRYLRNVVSHPKDARKFNSFQLQRLTDQGYRFVVLDRALAEAYATLNEDASIRNRRPFEVQEMLSQQLGKPWAIENRYIVWALVDTPPAIQRLQPNQENQSEYNWEPETVLLEVEGMN
ncbi:MAG: hypothetical protein ACON4U_01755 [Myxococcota bacterium]